MKKTFRVRHAAFILLGFITGQLAAQYNIQESYAERLRNGTTFVVLKNPEDPSANDYKQVVQKHWNVSKVEFIDPENVKDHLQAGNFFLSFGSHETRSSMTNRTKPTDYNGIDITKSRVHLLLWTPDEDWLKKTNKPFDLEDRSEVARVEQPMTIIMRTNPDRMNDIGLNQAGTSLSWGPGLLKNYLQQLNAYLASGKSFFCDAYLVNEKKLRELKTGKLFVPDFALYGYKINCVLGNCSYESETLDHHKIFAHYKSPYSVISTQELNDRIMTGKEPFYYLSSITSGSDNFISIINSQTGEPIYQTVVYLSKNLKPKDIKQLYKLIGKSHSL